MKHLHGSHGEDLPQIRAWRWGSDCGLESRGSSAITSTRGAAIVFGRR